MLIDTVVTGRESGLYENCYIVRADGSQEAVVIDPGEGSAGIENQIDRIGVPISYILLTHGHADHIASALDLKEKYHSKIAIHKKDAGMLTDPAKNLSCFIGDPVNVGQADLLLEDGDVIDAAGLAFRVVDTPGHTPGGVCFIVDDESVIFSGDTLFAGSIGRTDFPGSDHGEMQQSLGRLRNLEGDYQVYSGHGPATTLNTERDTNPFMRG